MRTRLEPLTAPERAVSPQRARIAGAVRLEGRATWRGAAMGRHDHHRSADAAGRAQPRRGFERAHRRERQGLSGCRRDPFAVFGSVQRLRCCWCVIGGCTPGGQFDPTEAFNSDMFDTKKKIAGRARAAVPRGRAGGGDGRAAGFGERLPAAAGAGGRRMPPPPTRGQACRAVEKSRSRNQSRKSRARRRHPAHDPHGIRRPASSARRRNSRRRPTGRLRSRRPSRSRLPTPGSKRTGRLRRQPGKRSKAGPTAAH
jgi:hypothetical protein